MPETYSDDNGNRIIVRHAGPAGRGIPTGGTTGQILVKVTGSDYDTQWANEPAGTGAVVCTDTVVDGEICVFDGNTGKIVRGGNNTLSFYASTSSVETKVDKVVGKGLSTEDFTTPEKTKLGKLAVGGFRGTFATFQLLDDYNFVNPVPQLGDYCYIVSSGVDLVEALWDNVNSVWFPQSLDAVNMSNSEIANVLFEDVDNNTYSQADCRIFTSGEKSQLAALSSVAGITAPAYGSLSYFDLTGTAVTILTLSNGSNNMVKVAVPTALTGLSSLFNNGGSDDGRIQYTGTVTRLFWVTAKVAFTGTATDVLVFGIAKSGSVDAPSRALAAGTVGTLTLSALISMAGNDYLEVFVGNTTDTSAPTVKVLSIEVASL